MALLAAYAWPGPARDATGYPGPLGPAPDVPRRLAPLRPEGDEELACDVVVVGSGAGGGVVAAELARAGLDVVVLEKGGYLAERDFPHQEGDAYRDLYLYAMTLTTDDLACRIVAGSTLGGGTVVNYSTSFATPPAVLAEWAAGVRRRGLRLRRGRRLRWRRSPAGSGSPRTRAAPASATSCWSGAWSGSAGTPARCPATSAAAPRTPAAAGAGSAAGSGPSSRPWSPTWRRPPRPGPGWSSGPTPAGC